MPMIEAELTAQRFGLLVQTLASAGPIPVGVLKGLGASRLISSFRYDSVEIGPAPNGFSVPPGTISARTPLTVQHVSTTELDTDPNAAGSQSSAVGWLTISATTSEIHIHLLAVDAAGAGTQFFPAPILLAQRSVSEIAEGGIIIAAAILLRDGIVTLRFATAAADPLFATPLNVLSQSGGDWAIRVSGEALAQQLLVSLQDGLNPPPGGTVIEDAPNAAWVQSGGEWVATGSVGLEKIDACWGLFEDVDISVTVNVRLRFIPDLSVTPPLLNLQLHVSTDASDWDSFRCWLGSGGLGSIVLGGLIGPLVGVVAGVVSLIAIAETIRLDAGSGAAGLSSDPLTLISSSDTEATYAGSRRLPTLAAALGIGRTSDADLGPLGLIVRGDIFTVPATHTATLNPAGGTLFSEISHDFNCRSRSWGTSTIVQSIEISDRARVFDVDLGLVPVTVFRSSVAVPANKWSIASLVPRFAQVVTIVGSSIAQEGDGGRIYLHTSAGIRRYDIAPLNTLPELTPSQQIEAVARCLKFEKIFLPFEKIKWLIDPPRFNYGYPPLRQWLIAFAELPDSIAITVHRIRNQERLGDPITFRSGPGGEAAIEVITDDKTELIVEHDQEQITKTRLRQRWLLPTQILPVGGKPVRLDRSGSIINVLREGGLLSIDLANGMVRQASDFKLSKRQQGLLVATETKDSLAGRPDYIVGRPETEVSARESMVKNAQPFSLTLPDGKVVAVFEDQMVIAIPWGTSGETVTASERQE